MSWQNNGQTTPGYPKFFSCDNNLGFPQNCTGSVEIDLSAVPRFSCHLLQTDDDPFPNGDVPIYDSKGICYIPYAGAFPSTVLENIRLTDVCAYPSRIPNSDFKDCIRYTTAGTPTLKVVKNVEGLETYRSAEWVIGISPLTLSPLDSTGQPADNNLIDDDETPTYALTPGTYTITETAGAVNPYPFMTISTQEYQCANLGGATVVYIPGPSATNWTLVPKTTPPTVPTITVPVALNDNWICSFRNTYTSVTAVKLYDFKATPQEKDILVEWKTASEYNNLGFNLFRATSAAGANYIKLNTDLIPPVDPGGMQGGEYSYVDSYNLDPTTTYYYWLQDVDLNGTLTLHGPVSARLTEVPDVFDPHPFKIFLPSIIGGN